ncbi:exonuclease SbcCD subunit D [Candidatus Woesearchaeota archaeon]|nr:exonuclease SbcCD subunit D [Candidatus Woesearchaeota archaeon]
MKYAHLADLHLGSWRDEKMRTLSTQAFLTAIDQCLEEKVDFILFAGDLFNTSLPALDTLKIVTKKLKELYDKNIPLYVIPGSHDFSPSGKTMIDVLENAGLLINVHRGEIIDEVLHLKFTTDPKTGAKITGVLGKRGMLDRIHYDNLILEQTDGYKIFMFHTSVTELMPIDLEMVESQPLSAFPKGCNYYAGGHIHYPNLVETKDYVASYTGSLFPVNFHELEKYGKGGYYIVTYENNQQNIVWKALEPMRHQGLNLNCAMKSPEMITFEILNHFNNQDLKDTLITIKLKGKIQNGNISDINFKHIFEQLYNQGAYFIMKNTNKLQSENFQEMKISNTNPEFVEEEIIKEHLQQQDLFDKEKEFELTKQLISTLNTFKKEGEKVSDYNKRVIEEIKKSL